MAERKNQHIIEIAYALPIGAKVSHRYWSDAITTLVYLSNKMPSKAIDFHTPLQVLSNHFTLSSVLIIPTWVFGCVAFVHLHKNQHSELNPCGVWCVFLRYVVHNKGYRCHDPITKKMYETMNVTFLELETFFISSASNSSLKEEIKDKKAKLTGISIAIQIPILPMLIHMPILISQ